MNWNKRISSLIIMATLFSVTPTFAKKLPISVNNPCGDNKNCTSTIIEQGESNTGEPFPQIEEPKGPFDAMSDKPFVLTPEMQTNISQIQKIFKTKKMNAFIVFYVLKSYNVTHMVEFCSDFVNAYKKKNSKEDPNILSPEIDNLVYISGFTEIKGLQLLPSNGTIQKSDRVETEPESMDKGEAEEYHSREIVFLGVEKRNIKKIALKKIPLSGKFWLFMLGHKKLPTSVRNIYVQSVWGSRLFGDYVNVLDANVASLRSRLTDAYKTAQNMKQNAFLLDEKSPFK